MLWNTLDYTPVIQAHCYSLIVGSGLYKTAKILAGAPSFRATSADADINIIGMHSH
jgi:hypothetical protein